MDDFFSPASIGAVFFLLLSLTALLIHGTTPQIPQVDSGGLKTSAGAVSL